MAQDVLVLNNPSRYVILKYELAGQKELSNKFKVIIPYTDRSSGRGGIGRRAGFRILWGNPWGFKSLCPHQK